MSDFLDYEQLKYYDLNLKDVLKVWQKNHFYFKGDIVQYRGKYIECTKNGTSDKTAPLDIGNVSIGDTVADHDIIWKVIDIHNVIVEWKPNKTYYTDNICIYKGKLYRAKTAHTAGTDFSSDKGNWELISYDKTTDWEAGKKYDVADLCVYKYKIYRCKTAHTSSSTMSNTELSKYWEEVSKSESIPPWQTNTSYNVGDIVYQNESVFICTKAHTSGTFVDDYLNLGCWNKFDRRCVMTRYSIPRFLVSGELFFDPSTGLRYSTTNCKAPTTDDEFKSYYKPVPASLVNYDYVYGSNYSHLYNEIAYCGKKRLYRCEKDEPLSLPSTPHGIESYRITYLDTEQIFRINSYDNDSGRYYGELIIKLPQASNVTKVSFGRFFHKGGAVSGYSDVIIYTSSDGTNYKPVYKLLNSDYATANFTATHCTHVKIRMYGRYSAGDSHSNEDALSVGSIDIHGLSPYWTQIKDERILDYDSSKTYESQDVAVLNRKLYRCAFPVDRRTNMSYDYITKNPQWESLIADIDHWTAGTLYAKGSSVIYNHALFECLELHTASADFKTDLEDKSPKWVQISGVGTGDIATEDEVLSAMTAVITED